ncbi:hypothetical protein GGR56DRAFT_180455 [Xylariaceae sp. FL0804]|nr:hypothetical protein GGR56DRAFT_180455 [Xylariaceae sp. FL0804]
MKASKGRSKFAMWRVFSLPLTRVGGGRSRVAGGCSKWELKCHHASTASTASCQHISSAQLPCAPWGTEVWVQL